MASNGGGWRPAGRCSVFPSPPPLFLPLSLSLPLLLTLSTMTIQRGGSPAPPRGGSPSLLLPFVSPPPRSQGPRLPWGPLTRASGETPASRSSRLGCDTANSIYATINIHWHRNRQRQSYKYV